MADTTNKKLVISIQTNTEASQKDIEHLNRELDKLDATVTGLTNVFTAYEQLIQGPVKSGQKALTAMLPGWLTTVKVTAKEAADELYKTAAAQKTVQEYFNNKQTFPFGVRTNPFKESTEEKSLVEKAIAERLARERAREKELEQFERTQYQKRLKQALFENKGEVAAEKDALALKRKQRKEEIINLFKEKDEKISAIKEEAETKIKLLTEAYNKQHALTVAGEKKLTAIEVQAAQEREAILKVLNEKIAKYTASYDAGKMPLAFFKTNVGRETNIASNKLNAINSNVLDSYANQTYLKNLEFIQEAERRAEKTHNDYLLALEKEKEAEQKAHQETLLQQMREFDAKVAFMLERRAAAEELEFNNKKKWQEQEIEAERIRQKVLKEINEQILLDKERLVQREKELAQKLANLRIIGSNFDTQSKVNNTNAKQSDFQAALSERENEFLNLRKEFSSEYLQLVKAEIETERSAKVNGYDHLKTLELKFRQDKIKLEQELAKKLKAIDDEIRNTTIYNQEQIRQRVTAEINATAQAINAARANLDNFSPKVDEINKLHTGFTNLFKRIWEVHSIWTAQNWIMEGLTETPKKILEVGIALDSVKASLESTMGSASGMGSALLALNDEAKRTGIEVGDLRTNFKNFQASTSLAGITLKDTWKMFQNINEVQTSLHATTDETNHVFLAFAQIVNKGKVQSEELVKQLGNLWPGAFAAFAASYKKANGEIGITTKELADLMKQGLVTPYQTLKDFTEFMKNRFSSSFTQASTMLNADIGRMKSSFTLLGETLYEIMNGPLQGIVQKITTVTDSVNEFLKTKDGMADYLGMVGTAYEKNAEIFKRIEDGRKPQNDPPSLEVSINDNPTVKALREAIQATQTDIARLDSAIQKAEIPVDYAKLGKNPMVARRQLAEDLLRLQKELNAEIDKEKTKFSDNANQELQSYIQNLHPDIAKKVLPKYTGDFARADSFKYQAGIATSVEEKQRLLNLAREAEEQGNINKAKETYIADLTEIENNLTAIATRRKQDYKEQMEIFQDEQKIQKIKEADNAKEKELIAEKARYELYTAGEVDKVKLASYEKQAQVAREAFTNIQKSLKENLEVSKEVVITNLKELEDQFKQGNYSLIGYFEDKARLELSGITTAIETTKQQLEAAKQYNQQEDIANLTIQLRKLDQESKTIEARINGEYNAAKKAYDDKLERLNASYEELTGKYDNAYKDKYQAQYQETLDLLVAQAKYGTPEEQAQANANLIKFDNAQANYSLQKQLQQIEKDTLVIQDKYANQLEEINILHNIGAMTEWQSLIKTQELNKQRIEDLQKQINLEKEKIELEKQTLDNNGNPVELNPALLRSYQKHIQELEKLKMTSDVVAQKIQGSLTNAFSNSFISFASGAATAGQAFNSLTVTILNDIASIAAQEASSQLVKWLFAGAKFAVGSFGSSGTNFAGGTDDINLSQHAKGGVFTNSIVSSPTLFKYGKGGQFGLMGEAGAEAIMPLSKDSKGRLGVHVNGGKATVINNYYNSSVSVDGRGKSDEALANMIAEKQMRAIATIVSQEQIYKAQRRGNILNNHKKV